MLLIWRPIRPWVLLLLPPDTGTDVAVDTAEGVAAPVVAADPATGMGIDAADDLFVDVAVFALASVWDGGDEATAAIPVLGTAAPAGWRLPTPAPSQHWYGYRRGCYIPRHCRTQTEGSR